jgi:hypothetical protein
VPAGNSSSVIAPVAFWSASPAISSDRLLVAYDTLHVLTGRVLLRLRRVHHVLLHLVPAGDQVHDDAEVRQHNDEDDPQRLAPATDVVATEDVAEDDKSR